MCLYLPLEMFKPYISEGKSLVLTSQFQTGYQYMKSLLCDGHMNEVYFCSLNGGKNLQFCHNHGLGVLLPLSRSWRIATITVLAYTGSHYHGLSELPLSWSWQNALSCSWRIASITVLAYSQYHGLGELPLSRSWRIATIMVLANCHYHVQSKDIVWASEIHEAPRELLCSKTFRSSIFLSLCFIMLRYFKLSEVCKIKSRITIIIYGIIG